MDPPPIQPHPQSLDASDSVPPPLSPVSVPRAPLPLRRPPLPTPRVYRVHPSGFRKLVQHLTGAPSSPQSPSSAALLITNNDDNAVHNNAHDQSGSSSKYSNWWPHNNAMLSPGTMESTEHRNYGCYDHDDNKSI